MIVDACSVVKRITDSSLFRSSPKAVRLLEYLINETEEKRGELIKEQSVGIDVFNRSACYDTGSDSIVRVEMSRLRKKIRQYYENEGKNDPYRLFIPKGRYQPVIIENLSDRNIVSSAQGRGLCSGKPILIFKEFSDTIPEYRNEMYDFSELLCKTALGYIGFDIIILRGNIDVSVYIDKQMESGAQDRYIYIFEYSLKSFMGEYLFGVTLIDYRLGIIIWERQTPLNETFLRSREFSSDYSHAVIGTLLSDDGIINQYIAENIAGKKENLDLVEIKAVFNFFRNRTLSVFHGRIVYENLIRMNEQCPHHPDILSLLARTCWILYKKDINFIAQIKTQAQYYTMEALAIGLNKQDSLKLNALESFHMGNIPRLTDLLKDITFRSPSEVQTACIILWLNYMADPDKELLLALKKSLNMKVNAPFWYILADIVDCINDNKFERLSLLIKKYYCPGVPMHYILRIFDAYINNYEASTQDLDRYNAFGLIDPERYLSCFIKHEKTRNKLLDGLKAYDNYFNRADRSGMIFLTSSANEPVLP